MGKVERENSENPKDDHRPTPIRKESDLVLAGSMLFGFLYSGFMFVMSIWFIYRIGKWIFE